MSEVKWTNEQMQAITENNSNILVAAAAGSGKTAVLVERIIHKIIDEKIDIDKMLVVTFTNSAASEMREKILKAIYAQLEIQPQNTHLQRQITLLSKASICTIHSFCLEVIRNHFYELELPSNFRIADTAEIDLLKQDVLDDLFEQKYIENNKDFLDLLETYTNYREDEPLGNLVLNLYRFIQSTPFPEKWLEEKIELFKQNVELKDFSQTIWGKLLLEDLKETLQDSILQLENFENETSFYPELEKYTAMLASDKQNLLDILETIDSWEETCPKMEKLRFPQWPINRKVNLEIKEKAKQARDSIKKKIIDGLVPIYKRPSNAIFTDFQKMLPILQKLVNLVLEFSNLFAQRKKEKNCIDFNDIEHFALQILVGKDGLKTQIAKKYENKFAEIAIDEYQDSNLVQEAILTSISTGNNIFMVGDVKQSIYKFRQARPELFLEKYDSYKLKEQKQEGEHLKIQLFRNFRSRQTILNFTNLVFESIMSKNLGDILYNETEYLNYGANYAKEENTFENASTQMLLIDLKEDESITAFKNDENNKETNLEEKLQANSEEMQGNEQLEETIEDNVLEARLVAAKIKELLKSNTKVYDKKEGYRNIKPKDIVILLRTTSNLATIYEKELSELDLPVFTDASNSYLDTVEIETILSILKILDNPLQEIPLAIVLRSAIFGFTDNDLISIRLTDRNCNFYEAILKAKISAKEPLKQKIDNLLEKLEEWKRKEAYLPLNELIWQIYIDTGYYQYVGMLPNGAMRQANLKTLFEKAKQYETASYKGLFHFIHFIEKLKKQNGDLSSAKLIGENEDVIRIMSIHKSKGLEFPIVFLCNAQKNFNLQDLNEVILFHQDLGFGPMVIDAKKRIKYSSIVKEAISLKMKKETLSEEERILYVALTRAKEKLFIIGRSKDLQKEIKLKKEQLSLYGKNSDGTIKLDNKLMAKGKSYLDWLLYVYLAHENEKVTLKGCEVPLNNIVTLQTYSKKELLETLKQSETVKENDFSKQIEEILSTKNKEESTKQAKAIQELLSWKYNYLVDTKLPTKTSVTKIKQEKMKLMEFVPETTQNYAESLETEEDKLKSIEENLKISKNENNQKRNFKDIVPMFMQEKVVLSNVHKGSIVHLCIQRLDEKQDYTIEKIKNLIESLVEKEIITKQEAQEIDINLIYNFTKSSIFKELKNAKEVHKEQPFYISLPANEIFKEAQEAGSEKSILVQGIIDLYYITEKDELILIDFKTDYIGNEPNAKEKILERYKVQLEIYKQALEQALGRKVDKAQLYLLREES